MAEEVVAAVVGLDEPKAAIGPACCDATQTLSAAAATTTTTTTGLLVGLIGTAFHFFGAVLLLLFVESTLVRDLCAQPE